MAVHDFLWNLVKIKKLSNSYLVYLIKAALYNNVCSRSQQKSAAQIVSSFKEIKGKLFPRKNIFFSKSSCKASFNLYVNKNGENCRFSDIWRAHKWARICARVIKFCMYSRWRSWVVNLVALALARSAAHLSSADRWSLSKTVLFLHNFNKWSGNTLLAKKYKQTSSNFYFGYYPGLKLTLKLNKIYLLD